MRTPFQTDIPLLIGRRECVPAIPPKARDSSRRRVATGVVGADGDDADGRLSPFEKTVSRCMATAVMTRNENTIVLRQTRIAKQRFLDRGSYVTHQQGTRLGIRQLKHDQTLVEVGSLLATGPECA